MKKIIKKLDKIAELIFYIICVPVLYFCIKWSIEDLIKD